MGIFLQNGGFSQFTVVGFHIVGNTAILRCSIPTLQALGAGGIGEPIQLNNKQIIIELDLLVQ